MHYHQLGNTKITVSELCFGVLPLGPLQADMTVEAAGELLLSAMNQGITFFDTAQMYGSYPHLRYALERFPNSDSLVISGKATPADYQGMAAAVEEGLAALGRDYFDIFMLHAARVGADLFSQRSGAWQCLQDLKAKGKVRAIGISTHNVATVAAAAKQPALDIIFALYNKSGIGILEGGATDMLQALNQAAAAGKAIYSMKLLGGGTLISDIREAFAFGRKEAAFSAHAVGMVAQAELALNLRIFNDEIISDEQVANLKSSKRWQLMSALCVGCGNCFNNCHSDALIMFDGRPEVVVEKCILCGYCAADCPEFAIRVR